MPHRIFLQRNRLADSKLECGKIDRGYRNDQLRPLRNLAPNFFSSLKQPRSHCFSLYSMRKKVPKSARGESPCPDRNVGIDCPGDKRLKDEKFDLVPKIIGKIRKIFVLQDSSIWWIIGFKSTYRTCYDKEQLPNTNQAKVYLCNT